MNPLPDGYTLESVAASACPYTDARQAAAIAEACFQRADVPTPMPIDDATVAWLPRPDVYCWVYSEDGRRFLPALRRWLATRGWVLRERQSAVATG